MTVRTPLIGALLALTLAACGGSDSDKGTPTPTATASAAATAKASATPGGKGTPVDSEQALVLAQLLERNWEHGGSTIAGQIPIQGQQVPISGSVDFRSGRGTASVGAPTPQARLYVWTRSKVYAQSAPGKSTFLAQTPAPKQDPVHFAIAFINLLSAETIDNTANIQDQNARFLRHDTLDGSAVDVYTYGKDGGTTYWVGRKSGLLEQVRADVASGGIIELRLSTHKAVKIKVPSAGQITQ